MQNIFGEHRHQHGVGRAQQADQTDEHEQQADDRSMACVENALVDKSPGGDGSGRDRRSLGGQDHGQEPTDDRQVADPVNRETRAFSSLRYQGTG